MTFLIDNAILIVLALVSGGLLLWPKLSRRGGDASLSPLEATQLINHRNAIVVDVRDEKDFAAGSLAGARNIPSDALATRIGEVARFKARPVVVVCGAGQQSARALAAFREQGFAEAYTLAGGIAAWRQAALPLVQVARDPSRPALKDAARKPKSDNRGRPGKSTGAVTPSAIEPAAAVGESAMPAADVLTASDDAPAKAV